MSGDNPGGRKIGKYAAGGTRTWHHLPVINEDATLRLRVSGEDAEHQLRELRDWLDREDELRGEVRLRNRPIEPGQMGGLLDVIEVAVGSGGAVAVLAKSLSVWLTQNRADVKVTVMPTEHGPQIVVDSKRARDAQAMVREIGELAAKLHRELD